MTAETLNLTGYETRELESAIEFDAWAVRNEAERRDSLIAKKLARLYKQVADAECEQIQIHNAIEAAWKEIHK